MTSSCIALARPCGMAKIPSGAARQGLDLSGVHIPRRFSLGNGITLSRHS